MIRPVLSCLALLLVPGTARAQDFQLTNNTPHKARVYCLCQDQGASKGRALDPLLQSGQTLKPGVILPGIPMRRGGGPVSQGQASSPRIASITRILLTAYSANPEEARQEKDQPAFLAERVTTPVAILVPEHADLHRNPVHNPWQVPVLKIIPGHLDGSGSYELVADQGRFLFRRQVVSQAASQPPGGPAVH